MKIDLILGDCLEKMQDIPPASIDAIISDPPYGTTSCKWDSIIPFEPLWEGYNRIIKPNGVIVLTSSQPFTSVLISSNIKLFRHEWVWKKDRGSNFANTVREPMKEHENIIVFSCGKWTYNPQMQERSKSGLSRAKYDFSSKASSENYREFTREGRRTVGELRCPSSVQTFNRETGLHPTQKPVALFEYLIRTYTNEGELVLDNCMGSGTTAVACINTKRNFIGIEKDTTYFEIAKERIEKHQTQPLTLL
jgi:site-specific DNA-methyltransferase (adenine-specific)